MKWATVLYSSSFPVESMQRRLAFVCYMAPTMLEIRKVYSGFPIFRYLISGLIY
jgi:hypothetical protein